MIFEAFEIDFAASKDHVLLLHCYIFDYFVIKQLFVHHRHFIAVLLEIVENPEINSHLYC